MNEILVIGHIVKNRFDGQQSKTNDVIAFFKQNNFYVEVFDYGHVFKPFVPLKSIQAIKRHKNILIMPGGKNALFLYTFLSKRFKEKNFYYLAVGGWVESLIQNEKYGRKLSGLKDFKCIVLQNKNAIKTFESSGFTNVLFCPTFSSKSKLSEEQFKQSLIQFDNEEIIRFCFFARVLESKGIFEACQAVKDLNNLGIKVEFDIYGQIQEKNTEIKLKQYLDKNIRYKGVIFENCIETLASYYCMLFPTYYQGEGMAHSVIESFMAGLPVIGTDWRFNSELIKTGFTGLLIGIENLKEDLCREMLYAIKNKDKIRKMRINCYEESKKYDSDSVLNDFLKQVLANQ